VNAFIECFKAVEDEARDANLELPDLPSEWRRAPWSEPAVRTVGATWERR